MGLLSPASRHMGRVAAVGCIACRMLHLADDTPAQVHHVREGRQARNDFLTIPLCPLHHTGGQGIHHDKEMLLMRCGVSSEWDMLAETLLLIERERTR